uniref:Uncharacterized protein n=1 Tax=viral metagenome TaxID=1070528 RepID=A0A6H1ZZP0_9ZZZZ
MGTGGMITWADVDRMVDIFTASDYGPKRRCTICNKPLAHTNHSEKCYAHQEKERIEQFERECSPPQAAGHLK